MSVKSSFEEFCESCEGNSLRRISEEEVELA